MESNSDRNREDQKAEHPNEAGGQATGSPAPSRIRLIRVISERRWLMVALLLIGTGTVAVALFFARNSGSEAGRPVPAPSGTSVPPPSSEASGSAQPMPGDLTIRVMPDELENAQIRTETATLQASPAAQSTGGLRTTGTIQANEYKETPVFPIAGGIIRRVNAELGDRVRRGQMLAVIFSTELADAQSDYLRMLAEEEEHHQHYRRTLELLEIGAVSREELEMVTARHKTAQARTASARQRLLLLGLSPKQVDALKTAGQVSSLMPVPAPVSGEIIDRAVNAGEVVEKGKELFRVVDLSTVWVIGQIYENDFRQARLGTRAVITTPAYPDRTFSGRVSYIDPRVDPGTRTAQVRVEVPNPGQTLKLGMFVDVILGDAASTTSGSQPAVLVPRGALQAIGAKQVVYLATDQPGVFVQREVMRGPEANGLVPIYNGVRAGDRVVTDGSFLLRAESLKLNPAQSMDTRDAHQEQAERVEHSEKEMQQTESEIQTVKIRVTANGFEPASITVRKDVPVRLTFVREVEVTCATEVIFPDYDIKRALPLNEPVAVDLTPNKSGEIGFACGMDMVRGKLVVK